MRWADSALRARGTAAALALVLASLAPAAGGGDVRTIEVTAKEFEYVPSQIQVKEGETVRLKLVNKGVLSHNLHIRGAGLHVHTKTIQTDAGDTIELTVPEDGTIEFFCNVPGHKEAGMKGKIVVE